MQIVVLANSVMHGGSCIAGKVLGEKSWIRLKGDCESGITKKEQCLNKENCDFSCDLCANFLAPKLLNIIEVETINGASSSFYQTENFKFNSSNSWKHIKNLEIENLYKYLDEPDNIWGDFERVYSLKLPSNSLYFLEVSKIKLYWEYYENLGYCKRKAEILYNGFSYKLACTAGEFDVLYYKHGENFFSAYITISLGEIYKGYAYKLVAGIIEK